MSNFLKNSPGLKKEVMDLNLVEGSFRDELVQRETPSTLFCKKHDGYTPIIFKHGPGWMGKVKRWLSVEGVPLVHSIDLKGHKVTMTVPEYLKNIWGDKGYDGLPSKLKESLLAKIGITVSIQPIEIDPENEKAIKKLKANSALYDADLEMAASLGTSTVVKKNFDKLMDKLPWVLAGFGLTYVLQGLGVLH